MTGSTDLLDAAAQARVAAAVGRAEARTSGEIVVMLSARAGRYRSVVLLAALIAGLLVPWPLIAFTDLSAASIALAQAGTVAAFLAATLHEPLRLALVPRALRRGRAREAARRAFWTGGLSRTQGRTGLLLFLAVAEHHAEIVADEGLLRRIDRGTWDALLTDLLAALARGEAEAGLVAAVTRIGTHLEAAFPADRDNPDELPNRVILLD